MMTDEPLTSVAGGAEHTGGKRKMKNRCGKQMDFENENRKRWFIDMLKSKIGSTRFCSTVWHRL